MFRRRLFLLELKLTFVGILCRINLLAWSLLVTGSLTGNLTSQQFNCGFISEVQEAQWSILVTGHFRIVFRPQCQNQSSFETIHENAFHQQVHFHATQTHFHMKDFAWEFVLTLRQKTTRKWPRVPDWWNDCQFCHITFPPPSLVVPAFCQATEA